MDAIKLRSTKNVYGDDAEPDNEVLEMFDKLKKHHAAGKPIYIKILSGDRKGSIALFETEEELKSEFHERYSMRGWGKSEKYLTYSLGGSGKLKWTNDGRRNKIKFTIPGGYPNYCSVEWLPDYEGPTVYKMLDKKAVAKKRLEGQKPKDIDGNELAVGDHVLYANIRYGGGTELTRGTILEFKVSVGRAWNTDKVTTRISTIIQNDYDKNEKSKINFASTLILKLDK